MSTTYTRDTCPDPCHDPDGGPTDELMESYTVELGPGFWATGYRCRTCRFETFTQTEVELAARPCPRCGGEFDGAADNPDEICDNCWRPQFDANWAAWKEAGYPGAAFSD